MRRIVRGAACATAFIVAATVLFPAAALAKGGFQHQLYWILELETGKTIDMPFLSFERAECLREAKRVEIGRKIPRGMLVFPGGKTYAATMIGAKCVMTDRKN
jgi:hypothetical protein